MRLTAKNPVYAKYDVGEWTFGSPTIVECEGEQGKLKIGKFCSIADGVKILLGGEHNYKLISTYPFDNLLIRFKELGPTVKTKGDVIIGNDVWIGYGAIILSGVKIGDGAVIGAGSVVARSVPAFAVVAGNPARVFKYRFSREKVAELLEMRWWDLPWKELREKIPWLLAEPQSVQ